MNADPTAEVNHNGIDLVALLRAAWRRKFLITASTAFCGLVATYAAFTATPIYRAEVVVTQVHDRGMVGASSIATQLNGIASLAGISVPSGDDSSRAALAVLQSRHLI